MDPKPGERDNDERSAIIDPLEDDEIYEDEELEELSDEDRLMGELGF